MVDERKEHTLDWWNKLKPHVQGVYYNSEHDQITQSPIFVELLSVRRVGCTGSRALQRIRGDRWTGAWTRLASQDWWQIPISHLGRRLESSSVPTLWTDYATTGSTSTGSRCIRSSYKNSILAEWRLRIGGLAHRGWWLWDSALGALWHPVCIQLCSRSGHNATVRTFDTPYHHGVQTHVEIYPRPSTRSDSHVKYGVRTYPQHADSLLWMNRQTASQYYAALVDRCC